jgi:hypothetical protein
MADLTASSGDAADLTDTVTVGDRVQINGLDMSVDTWNRIRGALRGLHPNIPAGMSDAAMIQQVMQYMVIEWVASWEARQAAPEPYEVAQQALQRAADARVAAETAARQELGADIHPTVTS